MSTFVCHQSSDAIENGSQQHITEAIVTFVAENLQSLSIVESKAFSKILAIAKPRYQMPSRKYLSNILLSNRHDKICTDIICKLSKVSQICLTMDIWSNRQMHSFLGVTAHFINNFHLESVMLACCHFHGSHTKENILCQYEAITTSFNIHDKVRSVITDNAAKTC